MTSSDQLTDQQSAHTEQDLVSYLTGRLKTEVAAAQDLFDTGLVSSMFAMELVVYLEQCYEVAIVGPDLKLKNFRSARSMAALVHRLKTTVTPDAGAG